MDKRSGGKMDKVESIIEELQQMPNSKKKIDTCNRVIDSIHNNKELIELTFEFGCLIPPKVGNETYGSDGACLIKGNVSFNTSEKIYHLPGCYNYEDTTINEDYGEQWFCSEQEAVEAGWRKADNCEFN